MSQIENLLFLGTGTSSSVPNIPCLTEFNPSCKVCLSSITPQGKKNFRRNTSILLKVRKADGTSSNILVDCGKTFRESALDFFPKNNIDSIDAVLLTHPHADAVLGLDDLRPWTARGGKTFPINVFCSIDTFDFVKSAFPYLVSKEKATEGGGDVATLNYTIISPNIPFLVEGLNVIPFQVEHGVTNGSPYYCLGFRFNDVTYISDCNFIPTKARQCIENSSILIVDALGMKSHPSHFCLWEALKEVRYFAPKRAFFTGFCHRIDHYELEEILCNRKFSKTEGELPLKESELTLLTTSIDSIKQAVNQDEVLCCEVHSILPAYDGLLLSF